MSVPSGLHLPSADGSFICTHLEAHDHNIKTRNAQYQSILSSLVFRSSDPLSTPYQVFDSSHLFIMGDLNYRLAKLPSTGWPKEGRQSDDILALEKERADMVELDTLRAEQREGRVAGGLREGDLSRFAPTYKRIVGQVDGYTKWVSCPVCPLGHAHLRKRVPGWTDRILFASWTDPTHLFSPQTTLDPIPAPVPSTTTQIVAFSSTPELTISDHKPVHAILELPAVDHSISSPHLAPVLPPAPSPHARRPQPAPYEQILLWKVIGILADRIVGWPWCLFVLVGGGNLQAGMGVSAFIAMIWGVWWSGVYSG